MAAYPFEQLLLLIVELLVAGLCRHQAIEGPVGDILPVDKLLLQLFELDAQSRQLLRDVLQRLCLADGCVGRTQSGNDRRSPWG